jgi:tetratricopeptide (TPR) repeat protein
LGQYYLIRAARLNEPDAYDKAENLLSHSDSFKTNEGQTEALLLRAQAASSYEERDKLFRQLALEYPKSAKGWYLKGLNDFEEGKIRKDQAAESFIYFDRSLEAFAKAFHLFKSENPAQAALTAKYQALANDNLNKPTAALAVLDNLIDIYPALLKQMEHPDEIFHLKALIAAKLSQIPVAEDALQIVLEKYPEGKFFDDSLSFLALLKFRQGLYQEALKKFLLLAEQHPNSPLAGDALAMAANCCDHLKLEEKKSQDLRKQCFEYYPGCSLAPEAYFNYFTYRDYLQGDRVSMKHLLGFTSLYPNHPLLLNTHYLIGLDQTRDRKSQEGKWIRKKNLTSAIDSFLEVETHFDLLHQKQLLPSENLEYYISLKYRATLERALANLSIADESLGAKRQIYLTYAEEVLKQLKDDFETPEHPLTKYLSHSEPLPSLFEENLFWLAQCYLKMPDHQAGKEILNLMLEKYRASKVTRGYFLSRIWYEKGMLALTSNEYSLALQSFLNAEDAAKGKVLSTDQKLDLWIQQSLCYQGLNQLNQAILILSKVVNDDAVSGLRLKAMYLRAENYERQGRLDLARKQLEAISKKGGEWALKSKNKLDRDYGYQ